MPVNTWPTWAPTARSARQVVTDRMVRERPLSPDRSGPRRRYSESERILRRDPKKTMALLEFATGLTLGQLLELPSDQQRKLRGIFLGGGDD